MDFNLHIPVRVLSGNGVLPQNAALLKRFGSKCLIVTGKHSAAVSGALDDMKNALRSQDIAFDVFSEIGPNPLLSACHKAGALARSMGADFIVGIGGGSAPEAEVSQFLFDRHCHVRVPLSYLFRSPWNNYMIA